MSELAKLISTVERLRPEADNREVARLCLILMIEVGGEITHLIDDQPALIELWDRMNCRMQQATDQYAGMADELDNLASESEQRGPDLQHVVTTLVRAVSVQSQLLSLYIGQQPRDRESLA